ncbi:MAG: hypothetical protein IJC39_04355 [Firmicutes bacterium]|nr:hypothetical protein [Bacillota bacterium]
MRRDDWKRRLLNAAILEDYKRATEEQALKDAEKNGSEPKEKDAAQKEQGN